MGKKQAKLWLEVSKEIPCGIFFSFPFEVSGPFEKRKHGGSYVFNYFAYIVTLLRLWFYLVFFLSWSPPPPSARLPSYSYYACHPTSQFFQGGYRRVGDKMDGFACFM